MGEFSSYDAGRCTDQDPMRWNTTVVQLADAEGIAWTYFVLNGIWDPATARMGNEALWDEAADHWNQPVLDTFDQARAAPGGASCAPHALSPRPLLPPLTRCRAPTILTSN